MDGWMDGWMDVFMCRNHRLNPRAGAVPPHLRMPWVATLSFSYMTLLSMTRGAYSPQQPPAAPAAGAIAGAISGAAASAQAGAQACVGVARVESRETREHSSALQCTAPLSSLPPPPRRVATAAAPAERGAGGCWAGAWGAGGWGACAWWGGDWRRTAHSSAPASSVRREQPVRGVARGSEES